MFLVARIKIVKADKATMIEDNLVRMAQSRRLASAVTEKQLVQMLEDLSKKDRGPTVRIESKR
jgi:DNA-binding TFAR19-related protein (PDSD5 family)